MIFSENEMRGLLTGKCIPSDMKVNEELPAYLVRKFAALQEQVQKLDAMKMKLSRQLNIALQNLNADIELLCIVGSYGDTQSDEDILECLEQYNERGTCMQEIICPSYKWEPKP
jgi:hypothetical protein